MPVRGSSAIYGYCGLATEAYPLRGCLLALQPNGSWLPSHSTVAKLVLVGGPQTNETLG
jgi:hypothetical protein